MKMLVATMNGCSRDFVDPWLLNFHLHPAKMNVEVVAHEISRLFWSDLCSADGGGPANGDEGFTAEKSSSDKSSDSGVTVG